MQVCSICAACAGTRGEAGEHGAPNQTRFHTRDCNGVVQRPILLNFASLEALRRRPLRHASCADIKNPPLIRLEIGVQVAVTYGEMPGRKGVRGPKAVEDGKSGANQRPRDCRGPYTDQSAFIPETDRAIEV